MTVARATLRGPPPFSPSSSRSARVSHRLTARPDRYGARPPSLRHLPRPPPFGQQPNRRVVCETLIPTVRVPLPPAGQMRRVPRALLRGQKEEHEKVRLGRVCRPRREEPRRRGRAAAQARLPDSTGPESSSSRRRGGANKNGKDSADIVPAQGERRAQSSRARGRKPPAPDVPARKAVPTPNPPRKAPAPAPAPAGWRIPTRAST